MYEEIHVSDNIPKEWPYMESPDDKSQGNFRCFVQLFRCQQLLGFLLESTHGASHYGRNVTNTLMW